MMTTQEQNVIKLLFKFHNLNKSGTWCTLYKYMKDRPKLKLKNFKSFQIKVTWEDNETTFPKFGVDSGKYYKLFIDNNVIILHWSHTTGIVTIYYKLTCPY